MPSPHADFDSQTAHPAQRHLPLHLPSPLAMKSTTKTEKLVANVIDLMATDQDWTIPSLAAALGISSDRTRLAIHRLVNAGKIYHSHSIEPSHKNVYRLAAVFPPTSGAAFISPANDTGAEREAVLNRRHRRHTASWPAADPTLTTAMFALVRTHSPSCEGD